MTNGEKLLYDTLKDASTITDGMPDSDGWVHVSIDADWWNGKSKEPEPEPEPSTEDNPDWEPTTEEVAAAMIERAYRLGQMANAAGSMFEDEAKRFAAMLVQLWVKDTERRADNDYSI